MERNARSKLNAQIYEEASEWFIEYRSGDLDEAGRREFDAWLRKSPENLSAYLEIAAIWNEGPSLDPQGRWDRPTLIAQAIDDPGNVVPLAGVTPPAVEASPAKEPRPASRRRLFASAASIAALGVATSVLLWSGIFGATTYETALGEQRSIVLDDGSTVDLNSRSKIRLRYSERERGIELLEGQALFRVAKDHTRPFVVTSDTTRVRAVGTQFDVYRKREGTVVTVVEGRVAILTAARVPHPDIAEEVQISPKMPSLQVEQSNASAANGLGPGILLSAGEQISVTPTAVEKAHPANIASATAWTQRQLVFDSASLTEVAEEFNRYNERQLVIRDAALYDFHISGVFSSADPTSLIRFLRERPGVQVVETSSQIQVMKKDR